MTGAKYELNVKTTFLNQLLSLPQKRVTQILEKIETLVDDPTPREPVKKRLHGVKGELYRLRCGDYRVLYTFGNGWVSVNGVDDRKDVYRGELLVEAVPSIPASEMPDEVDLLTVLPSYNVNAHQYAANQTSAPSVDEPLPRAINRVLLRQLRIAPDLHPELLTCKTIGDLCAADVPESVRSAIFDTVTTPDYLSVIQRQPDLKVQQVSDLQRYYDGDLMGFLLR